MTKLLLVGATGLVGGEVLQLAYAEPRVSQVIALTRRPLNAHENIWSTTSPTWREHFRVRGLRSVS